MAHRAAYLPPVPFARPARFLVRVTRLPAFASLRHRNFRLFLGGQLLSLAGTWIQTVAQSWLVLELSNSAFIVGLVTTLGSLPVLLFTLHGGVVADRVNKRRFIIILQALMLVEALILGLLVQFHVVTVAWVTWLAVGFGFLAAYEVPARQAFVVDLVGKTDLMNAIALNSSAFNVARVIGPAIAGIVIAALGLAMCFYLNALSFVAVLWGLALIRLPAGPAPESAGDFGSRLREGFHYVFTNRWPRTLILLTATLSIFGFSFLVMLPVFARDALRVGAAGYGATMAAVGIGAAVAALGLAAFGSRVRQGRTAVGAALALGVILILTGLLPWLAVSLAFCAAAGCAMALSGISTNTLLQRLSPDALRGRVMGFYSFVALGMAPIGALQAGWVSQRLGVRWSFALDGAVSLAAAGLVIWSLHRSRGMAAAAAGVTLTP